MMKKTVYEAPVTERFQVELEGVFCASADVENPETGNGKVGEIANQTVNSEFDSFDGKFDASGWE